MARCDDTELPVDQCGCKKHRPDLAEKPKSDGPVTLLEFLESL